ncbi:MAG: hypothetical protein KGL35_00965 [Bradyrhizobium sp.]|nr:hypothetical protein [Bradyrhizobium sp.]
MKRIVLDPDAQPKERSFRKDFLFGAAVSLLASLAGIGIGTVVVAIAKAVM